MRHYVVNSVCATCLCQQGQLFVPEVARVLVPATVVLNQVLMKRYFVLLRLWLWGCTWLLDSGGVRFAGVGAAVVADGQRADRYLQIVRVDLRLRKFLCFIFIHKV